MNSIDQSTLMELRVYVLISDFEARSPTRVSIVELREQKEENGGLKYFYWQIVVCERDLTRDI